MVKSERKDCSILGSLLILIGGILAIISSLSRLIFTFFLRRVMLRGVETSAAMDRWGRGLMASHMARGILGFAFIGAIITIIVGIVAVYSYTKVKGGSVKNGGLIAIIVAIMMLVTTHWIAGILTLIGGILCYTSESATSNL